jgi:hypothetical protein
MRVTHYERMHMGRIFCIPQGCFSMLLKKKRKGSVCTVYTFHFSPLSVVLRASLPPLTNQSIGSVLKVSHDKKNIHYTSLSCCAFVRGRKCISYQDRDESILPSLRSLLDVLQYACPRRATTCPRTAPPGDGRSIPKFNLLPLLFFFGRSFLTCYASGCIFSNVGPREKKKNRKRKMKGKIFLRLIGTDHYALFPSYLPGKGEAVSGTRLGAPGNTVCPIISFGIM